MIRAAIFIALLLGMAYVVFFQAETVKEHDMDKAKNEIQQTHDEVDKMVNDYEDKLEQNMQQLDQ